MTERQMPTELERITAIMATQGLIDALEHARQQIGAHVVEAYVYAIPTLTVDQMDDDPPTAPVIAHTGEPAIHAGLEALCRTEYGDRQHPQATLRRPGVIRVDTDLSALVSQVNACKTALRTAMKPFHFAAWRHWRPHVPDWSRFNRLQAYREWHWLGEPLRRIGLGWAGSNTGTEYLRIGALMKRLADQRRHGGHDRIREELKRLAEYDADEVIAISRPVAPTPMANLRTLDGIKQVRKTALPLLTDQPVPRLTPLKDFVPSDSEGPRHGVVIENEPLVAHWHAYRLVAARRFHLRDNPVKVRLSLADRALVIERPGQGAVMSLAHAGVDMLARVVAAAGAANGAAVEHMTLDAAGDIVLVGANRAHAFFDAQAQGVWRVPIKDLRAIARLTAEGTPEVASA